MAIGDKILALRKQLGWGQQQLAKKEDKNSIVQVIDSLLRDAKAKKAYATQQG
jgi:transcriptional regulator with XRE-family HTH domain